MEKSRFYQMPAEWHKHEQCWMLFPTRTDNWRDNALPAQRAFLNVAAAIARFEPVKIGVNEEYLNLATSLFNETDTSATKFSIEFISMNYNDSWMRDVGPTFVFETSPSDNEGNDKSLNKKLVGMNWKFNAWGGIYSDWSLDDLVAARVLSLSGVEKCDVDFVLEGGSIHVDGEGTVLVTEECLLNKNRNPQLSKQDIEKLLIYYLGVNKILWIPRGLAADEDTNGHIDNLCCFAKPSCVLLSWTDDEADEHFHICREAFNVLNLEKDAKNRSFEVVKIQIPTPMYYTEDICNGLAKTAEGEMSRRVGERLAGSYVNFYISNGGVIVPFFNDPKNDENAIFVIKGVFPGYEVMSIPGKEILYGGGNIHCITQQQPFLS